MTLGQNDVNFQVVHLAKFHDDTSKIVDPFISSQFLTLSSFFGSFSMVILRPFHQKKTKKVVLTAFRFLF